MRVSSAEFIKSAVDPEHFPRGGKPEFAFAGRSNVGKSSLLNRLLNRKGLAKTSATPGKTQTINFFDINKSIYFVDLPGYGYAKVPKDLKIQWNILMHQYLTGREPLKLVVQLLDARHAPQKNDIEMINLLDEAEVPTLIAATKIDKLSRSQRAQSLAQIREVLDLDEDALIVPFSSVTGEGVTPIWNIIDSML
jgi:GTP-binding protein